VKPLSSSDQLRWGIAEEAVGRIAGLDSSKRETHGKRKFLKSSFSLTSRKRETHVKENTDKAKY
jgi:hypothetical protein